MFYDKLLELAISNGYRSPTAAAMAIGMSGAHVSKWKKGSEPTDATKLKFAKLFNVPLSAFDDSDPPPTHPAYDKQLVELYWSLTPEGRDLLMDYAHMLQDRYGKKNNTVPQIEVTA